MLRVEEKFTFQDVTIYEEYYGEGYGMPTPEMVEAVQLVGRTQGIVLDPVYSGKAMSGLCIPFRRLLNTGDSLAGQN